MIAGARNVRDFFLSDKAEVFNIVQPNYRMEMLAYYDVGRLMPTTGVLGEKATLVRATDDYLAVNLSEASKVEMLMLTSGRDTVLYVVNTVMLPVPDSRLSAYSTDWKPLRIDKLVSLPAIGDFIAVPKNAPVKKADVEEKIIFPLISYSIDDSAKTLTARQQMRAFMGKDAYKAIAPYMTDSIVYERSGGVRLKRRK